MKIKVNYLDGRIKTYDTDTFCDSTPFLHDNVEANNCNDNNTNNISIMTSFDLRLDFLFDNEKKNEKGIYLFVDYYDIICDENLYTTHKMQLKNLGRSSDYYVTHIAPGRCVPVVNAKELPLISHIDVDGEMCIKNFKGHIINVQKQKELYSMWFGENNDIGLLEQIYMLYEYMLKEESFKNLETKEQAWELGIDEILLKEIIKNETIKNRAEKKEEEIIEIGQMGNEVQEAENLENNNEDEGNEIVEDEVLEVEEEGAVLDDVEDTDAVVEEALVGEEAADCSLGDTGACAPAPEEDKEEEEEEKFGNDAYSINEEDENEKENEDEEEKFGADAYKIENHEEEQNDKLVKGNQKKDEEIIENELSEDDKLEKNAPNLKPKEKSIDDYHNKIAEFDNDLFSDDIE